MKNKPKNLLDSTATRRKAEKGKTTQKKKRQSPVRRFYEVKIRVPAEAFTRGQPYFHEEKYLGRYLLEAYLERVNRAEANNKKATAQRLANDMKTLEPVLREMYLQGKLDFLNEKREGISNGEAREA